MTKQCNFCGNVYDSNETTCPFCMAKCDNAGTYATNTTKTSATKVKITRNINGNMTTETKTFFNEDTNFENKTIDELKNEINRLFDEDSENIHTRRNMNVNVNGKNINGALVAILVIVAIIVITFPFLIMLNFSTITTNDIQEEEYYDDTKQMYSDYYEIDVIDEYEDAEIDTWQTEVKELEILMIENSNSYFFTSLGELYYLHEKTEQYDTSDMKYTWWNYDTTRKEWLMHSSSDTPTVSPIYILDAKNTKNLEDFSELLETYHMEPTEIEKSLRFQETVFGTNEPNP